MRQNRLTPAELEVLLHYYYSETEQWDSVNQGTREAQHESLNMMKLLESEKYNDGRKPAYNISDMGKAHINQLLTTRFPVLHWVDEQDRRIVI